MKEYTIGDRKYVQRPLVVGQFNRLVPLIEGIRVSQESTPADLIKAFGGVLPDALAVVLLPEGEEVAASFEPNALTARRSHLEWNTGPEAALEVIEDFFDCNPVSSIFERLTGMMTTVREKAPKIPAGVMTPTQANGSSSNSAEATSPGAITSNGESRPASPSDGSTNETGVI